MKTTRIFAEKVKNNTVIERKEIGKAVFKPNGTISARKYDELKRACFKAFPRKEIGGCEYTRLVTEDGRKDTFGGNHPTLCVKFE